MSNFEERLLLELRAVVETPRTERGQRRAVWRRPRLALAGTFAVVLAVAVAAGMFFFSGGTQAAYAVTKNADGSVTVEIDSLTDAAGLQSALQAVGVNAVVVYLPEGKMCQQPWYTPAGHAAGETQQSGVGPSSDGKISFTLTADQAPGITTVITTQTGPGGETALGIGHAQGTVPACQVVDAPAGTGPLGGPPTGTTNVQPAP